MRSMLGIAAVSIISIYLAAVLQGHGAIVATDQLMWILGAAILGTSVGLLLFDP